MHITRSMFVSVSASVGLLLARPAGARSDRVIDPKAQAIVERGIEAVRTLDSLELVARSSLAGRVVLLDFWATWCGPCKAAMPLIQKLHDDYRGKPVTVLGVNVGERKPDAGRAYMKEKGFTYGCLLAGEELSNAYGITGIPTLVVIGKDGTVALLEVGLGPDGDRTLRAAIDAALAP